MVMLRLRNLISTEEFDSLTLRDALRDYSNPRSKITKLLKNQDIVQVKRGLYVFGERWRRGPVCIEALANMIYGPSYVSFEYALSYYGLIPERVTWITSVTSKRSKDFHTPLGRFSYQHLRPARYTIGINLVQVDGNHQALIALPEKALADHVARQSDLRTASELKTFLIESMRIEPHELHNLNFARLEEIARVYGNPRVSLLTKVAGNDHA